jgi:tetratricopeptide (TPR) repeat protein
MSFLLLIGLGINPQEMREGDAEVIRQANAAYEAGDYANAINLYNALLAVGTQDSRVYYNLGNAYYQNRQLGQALLQYRRAQAISPRDVEIQSALTRVRLLRLDIQGDETIPVDVIATLTSGILTLAELSWIVLAVWVGFFSLVMGVLLWPEWRGTLRVPVVLSLIVLGTGFLLLGCRWYSDSHRPAAAVVEHTVAVMSGPGSDYVELFRLHEAAEMRLLEKRGDWIRFVLPDARQGWLPEKVIGQV